MSMFTRKMKMLTAIVLDSKSEVVVKKLLELGVMDFVHLNSVRSDVNDKLSSHNTSLSDSDLADLRSRLETFYRQADMEYPLLADKDVEALSGKPDLDSYKRKLDKLSSSLLGFKEKQQQSNQKIIVFEEILSYIEKKKFEYLDLRVGTITRSDLASLTLRLSSVNAVVNQLEDKLVITSLRRDEARLSPLLDKFGWQETSNPTLQKQALGVALKEIETLKSAEVANMAQLNLDIKAKIIEQKSELDAMYVSVRLSQLCQHMESYFSYTDHTTLFSGWVPFDTQDAVESAIKEATDNICIIEWLGDSEVDRDKVPVSMTSPRFLKPFEHIVENYKTPEYGSINPVPFTAVTFMIMFMLMFADFGQGFVLLLIGILGKHYYKNHPMAKDGLISRYLCSLLIYLGPSSMVGGVLFGSYFGYSIFPALWFNYHQVVVGHATGGLVTSIFDILGITIKFGIIVIYTGLILNWINLVVKKRFMELIFDKNGLVGGTLYGVGIYLGFGFVATGYKTLPMNNIVLTLLIICLAILVIKGPCYTIYNKKHGKEAESIGQVIIDSVMDLLLDCLEIFSGFLSNTLSFMRIAGLGIAHVSLMVAFEDMAAMTNNIVFSILIMVIGNVLVLALEGLSAGIQSLRLNYYEFFTKYFTGCGVAYSPVGINSRIQLKK